MMKNKNIYWVIMIGFITISFGFTKQSSEEGCVDNLLKSLHQMASHSQLQKGKVYYLNMSQSITYNEQLTKRKPSHLNTVIAATTSKMLYENELVSMYVDEDESYTILHPELRIVHNKGMGREYDQTERIKRSAEIQDSIVRTGRLIYCKASKKVTGSKEIAIEPSLAVKSKTNLNLIRFTLDEERGLIVRVENSYNSRSVKKSDLIEYHKIDFDFKGKLFSKARSKVFDRSGLLKTAYKYYEVIDLSKS